MSDDTLELAAGSTNVLELASLRDATTQRLISDATVTASVYQSDKTTVVSGGSNLSCSAVGGRPGLYRGTLPSTAALPDGTVYVKYTAVSAGFTRVFWRKATVLSAANAS